MNKALKWLLAWLTALLLPFVLVLGSYVAIAYWVPGEVRREDWAGRSEIVFYLAVPAILYVAYASGISRWVRWPLAALGVMLFAVGIWYLQAVPLCNTYLGEKPVVSKQPNIRLASC